MRSFLGKTLIFAAILIAVVAPGKAQSLQAGSPAPRLPEMEYIKGAPWTGFERGRTYVVEFWATWCPPCRTSIPHLSEMARKRPDIAFIGVSAWDKDKSDVESFVAQWGNRMSYTVAFDGAKATDALWMRPAGRNGIPCAFVVGPDGRIAWIGHPMSLASFLNRLPKGGSAASFRADSFLSAPANRMRFLPPTERAAPGVATLSISADLVPRGANIETVIKVDGADAPLQNTARDGSATQFSFNTRALQPGKHLFGLLRRNQAAERDFVTDRLIADVAPDGSIAFTPDKIGDFSGEATTFQAMTPASPPLIRSETRSAVNAAETARQVWELTNRERRKEGHAPLPENPLLSRVAQAYAEEMAANGNFSHTGLDGSDPSARAKRAGYPSGCGENICLGTRNPAQTIQVWMNSAGHRKNILSDQYTEIGLGVSRSKRGATYWVQLFGTRR